MMYYITVTAFETLRLRQRKSYVLTIRLLWRAPRRCGGTGRRTGLKILRDLYSHTGSIPVAGIISRLYKNEWILILVQPFWCAEMRKSVNILIVYWIYVKGITDIKKYWQIRRE